MFDPKRTILLLLCLTILSASAVAAQEENRTGETRFKTQGKSNELFIIKVNKKRGFIDKTGKIVIEPKFDDAQSFTENRALVIAYQPEFRLNYIDETGKIIESLKFDNAKIFSEGLAAVGVGTFEMHGGGDHKWGFIDQTGKLIIPVTFRETRNFSENLAAVKNDEGKWGYIDKSGKTAIPFQFDDAFEFSEGLACVLIDGLFGFIDRSGKTVIAPRFAVPGRFREGFAAVEIAPENFRAWTHYGTYGSSGGKLAYIDKTGNEAFKIADNIRKITDFSEGLARIEVERKKKDFYTGFIDKTGREVIKLSFYSNTGKFSEGVSLIEKDKKFGFIDRTGKIIIAPEYKWADDFHNGLAVISTSKQIWDFEGTAKLGFEPNQGYIDKTGKIIWKPTN